MKVQLLLDEGKVSINSTSYKRSDFADGSGSYFMLGGNVSINSTSYKRSDSHPLYEV